MKISQFTTLFLIITGNHLIMLMTLVRYETYSSATKDLREFFKVFFCMVAMVINSKQWKDNSKWEHVHYIMAVIIMNLSGPTGFNNSPATMSPTVFVTQHACLFAL